MIRKVSVWLVCVVMGGCLVGCGDDFLWLEDWQRDLLVLANRQVAEDGVDGKDGSDGTDGVAGVDGSDGVDGLPGVDGVDGAKGSIGPGGPQGEQGDRGLNACQIVDCPIPGDHCHPNGGHGSAVDCSDPRCRCDDDDDDDSDSDSEG